MKAFWLCLLALVACGGAVPLSACSSNKNHAERENTPEALADVNPAHGEIVILEERIAARKAACVNTCAQDTDGGPVECAEQEEASRYEYHWAWDLGGRPLHDAPGTYVYDDRTTEFLVPERDRWQPVGDPVTRCVENPANFAMRLKGGPFVNYGGGFGMSFCTTANPCSNLPPSPEFPGEAVDLTSFDGIALWARRGPDGMANLRVGVTEKHSAEDLNTALQDKPEREGQYCSRYRLCGCAAGTPCTADKGGTEYCWDPAFSDTPSVDAEVCGSSRCDEFNTTLTAVDPLFFGRSCSNALQSDGLTASFCYNPGVDPNPPAKRERCGNPFVFPVRISTTWQLIKVPFTELRQSDEAAVADEFDLKSIRQLIFTHSTGWADFYISDVGFYRSIP